MQPLPSSIKLADALDATGDPRLQVIADQARENYYHPVLSHLTLPTQFLIASLAAADKDELIARVRLGEFAPSTEELESLRGPHGKA